MTDSARTEEIRARVEKATNREWWEITVSGYGAFGFYGTEHEADERRRDKADWEGGVGRKRRVSADSKTAESARAKTAWMNANKYPMSERELESLAALSPSPAQQDKQD